MNPHIGEKHPPSSPKPTLPSVPAGDTFLHLYDNIAGAPARAPASSTTVFKEKKKQKIFEIKTELDDAEGLIRKMDLEARSLQSGAKVALLAKLREYKSDLNSLKTELKRIISDQRGRLLMSTERLNHSSERIKESRRIILETEELGVSILQDLHQQHQSLLHANNTLHGVDDIIVKSRKILTIKSKRMDKNKWIISNMLLIWSFLCHRVRSDGTTSTARHNIRINGIPLVARCHNPKSIAATEGISWGSAIPKQG